MSFSVSVVSGALFFAGMHGPDSSDGHGDSENDEDNRQAGKQIVGLSNREPFLHLDDQREDCRCKHEPEGSIHEGMLLFEAKLDPGGDAQKAQSGDHLIGRAENGPDRQPCRDHLAAHIVSLGVDQAKSEDDNENRRRIHADFAAGNLLDLIASQTSRRIKRSQQEAVDGNGAQAGTERGVKPHKRRKFTKTQRENLHGRKSLCAFKAKHHQRTDGDDGHQTFDQHGAIADKNGILLLAKLLGRRAAADEAMETGNGAAGNQDEHGRPHGAGRETEIADIGSHHGNGFRIERTAGEHAVRANGHGKIQEVRGQVIAGLKEHPHRQNGSKENINAEERVPEIDVMGKNSVDQPRGRLGVHLDAAADDQSEHDDRDNPERNVPAIDHKAGDDSQDNIESADERDDRIGRERTGGHDQENGDDEDQREDRKTQEKEFSRFADPFFDNRTD